MNDYAKENLSTEQQTTSQETRLQSENGDEKRTRCLETPPGVKDGDTAETLAARILEREHRLYVESIARIVEGKFEIRGRCVLNRTLT